MKRREFLTASAFALLAPLAPALAKEEVCLKALEGVDVESNDTPFFTHYHQLIIPVSAIVNPPAAGIQLTTSVVDLGSCDTEALEVYGRAAHIDTNALLHHDHIVRLSREQLNDIAAGKKDVEVKVFTRDGKEYVHNFLVTAPPSLLAIVKKERK